MKEAVATGVFWMIYGKTLNTKTYQPSVFIVAESDTRWLLVRVRSTRVHSHCRPIMFSLLKEVVLSLLPPVRVSRNTVRGSPFGGKLGAQKIRKSPKSLLLQRSQLLLVKERIMAIPKKERNRTDFLCQSASISCRGEKCRSCIKRTKSA
ncbi:hypothetical protein LINGRAHAP2_LOCUS11437 [Linum grandiflorum]